MPFTVASRARDYHLLPPSSARGRCAARYVRGSQMSPDLATTGELLVRIRQGDRAAREALMRRFLPILTRWARGRLPGYARDLAQTDDLVQDTLTATLAHLNDFEIRREGAFLAYLRRALLNRVRDEIRRVRVRPVRENMDSEIADHRRSVAEQ